MEKQQASPFEHFEIPPFFRRKLLPLWMKVFCWIFIVMGVFAVLSFGGGLLGNSASIEFYGLSGDNSLSIMGISLTIILIFKAFTAYSLWFEKDNAITLAKIDATAGVIICISMMIIQPIVYGGGVSIRFEIIFLIAFYSKINQIEYAWYNKQHG